MIGWIRMGLTLTAIVVITIFVAVSQWIVLKTGIIDEKPIPRFWHRTVTWLLGIRIHVRGQMAAGRPLMIVANHISWTDIPVVGSLADIYFVAKGDMRRWPIMGKLATLQRTIFVERNQRRQSGNQVTEIGTRLAAGDPMVLFAEGSTSDGNMPLPFKSTLFEAARMALSQAPDGVVLIQPVAVAYTRLHGMPMGRLLRPHASWIGDQYLMPHVIKLLREGAMDVEIRYGEPIEFRQENTRKEIARLVEGQVGAMMMEALANPAKGA